MNPPPKLHLVGKNPTTYFNFGSVKVALFTSMKFLDQYDLMVLEDDTAGVLAADPEWRPNVEHPIRLMTNLINESFSEGGRLKREKKIIKAIVHDLDSEPTYQFNWIKTCYEDIQATCQQNHCRFLALQLLGCFHGRGPIKPSLELFIQALIETPSEHLKTVSLIVNHKSYVEAKAYLLALSGA